tara:strand:+ start:101 stop:403 length:303 start_codon:yes stop_codon:yes gene_type:complete
MKKFFIYLLIFGFVTACQSAREGFTLKKKDNSDEFLVEKKNPLVMPPEYSNLPVPEDFEKQANNDNEDDFEKIISTSKTKNTKSKTEKTNIEQSVLDKIN